MAGGKRKGGKKGPKVGNTNLSSSSSLLLSKGGGSSSGITKDSLRRSTILKPNPNVSSITSSYPATYGSADYAKVGYAELTAETDDSLDNSIDAIVLGSGVEKGGRTLSTGKWYASSREVCNQQTYFEIEIDSFRFEIIRTGESTAYQTINLSSKCKDPPKKFLCVSPSSKRQSTVAKEMTAKLKSFCRECPGLAVYLGGIGARDVNPQLEKYCTGASTVLL